MVFPLRPSRGGFLRPFGCGTFIKDYLLTNGTGAQTDIFREYKISLLYQRAVDMATRHEEKLAKNQKRRIDPFNINKFTTRYQKQIPFKSNSCRYHSFVTYFSMLIRLGWVEFTGTTEESLFAEGQYRKYYRLTELGMASDWSNPHRTLYG